MVLGVFTDRERAEDAVEDLLSSGFNAQDISVVMRNSEGLVTAGGDLNKSNPVAEGAVSGVTTGAVLGGLAGLLVGVGAIAVPGIGAILIGGPLATALGLTGAAAVTLSGAISGALAGGLVGALVNLGVPEEEAQVYERKIKEGAILLAVPTIEDDEVENILYDHRAEDVKTFEMSTERGRIRDEES